MAASPTAFRLVFNHSGQSALPILFEASSQTLHLESVLQDLPLYSCEIDWQCLGIDLAHLFEQHALLPGAVLVDQDRFVGMISRRSMMEYLLRPHGMELFLKEPLRVLYSYARSDVLLLPGTTPILTAAYQALRRSSELQGEPILVQAAPHSYYLLDIHALNIAYWQIRGIETQVRYERAQAQMIQSDKMASLGRLVDGVAHEILDPVSFIWGNLSHVSAYSDSLLQLIAAYEKQVPNPPGELVQLRTELEFDYVREDLPQAIESLRAGAERLSKLATSLQNFCHIDEVYPKSVDLHELIDGILLLLKSRLVSDIHVTKHYGQLPPVLCFAGQIHQVLMNILSDSVDALINQAVSQQLDLDFNPQSISSLSHPSEKPTIEITTQVCSGSGNDPSRWVSICIANNGPGLSAEAQKQILESFSVKKRAEKETSLSMSYQIITSKHGGKFEIRPRKGLNQVSPQPTLAAKPVTGTEFEILLPLA